MKFLAPLSSAVLVLLASSVHADQGYTHMATAVYYADTTCTKNSFVSALFSGVVGLDNCLTYFNSYLRNHTYDGSCELSNNDLVSNKGRDSGYNSMRLSCVAITDLTSTARFRIAADSYLDSVTDTNNQKLYISDSFSRNYQINGTSPSVNCFPADHSSRSVYRMDYCIPLNKDGMANMYVEKEYLDAENKPTGRTYLAMMNFADTQCISPVANVYTQFIPLANETHCSGNTLVQITSDANMAYSFSALSVGIMASLASYLAL